MTDLNNDSQPVINKKIEHFSTWVDALDQFQSKLLINPEHLRGSIWLIPLTYNVSCS